MCPFCGGYLKSDGYCSRYSCGYIETNDMSYEEICDKFGDSPVSYKSTNDSHIFNHYYSDLSSYLPF